MFKKEKKGRPEKNYPKSPGDKKAPFEYSKFKKAMNESKKKDKNESEREEPLNVEMPHFYEEEIEEPLLSRRNQNASFVPPIPNVSQQSSSVVQPVDPYANLTRTGYPAKFKNPRSGEIETLDVPIDEYFNLFGIPQGSYLYTNPENKNYEMSALPPQEYFRDYVPEYARDLSISKNLREYYPNMTPLYAMAPGTENLVNARKAEKSEHESKTSGANEYISKFFPGLQGPERDVKFYEYYNASPEKREELNEKVKLGKNEFNYINPLTGQQEISPLFPKQYFEKPEFKQTLFPTGPEGKLLKYPFFYENPAGYMEASSDVTPVDYFGNPEYELINKDINYKFHLPFHKQKVVQPTEERRRQNVINKFKNQISSMPDIASKEAMRDAISEKENYDVAQALGMSPNRPPIKEEGGWRYFNPILRGYEENPIEMNPVEYYGLSHNYLGNYFPELYKTFPSKKQQEEINYSKKLLAESETLKREELERSVRMEKMMLENLQKGSHQSYKPNLTPQTTKMLETGRQIGLERAMENIARTEEMLDQLPPTVPVTVSQPIVQSAPAVQPIARNVIPAYENQQAARQQMAQQPAFPINPLMAAQRQINMLMNPQPYMPGPQGNPAIISALTRALMEEQGRPHHVQPRPRRDITANILGHFNPRRYSGELVEEEE